MDRMLVVVFDNESKAYEGSRSLQQLDGDGSIAVYAATVIAKNPDGTTAVKQGADSGPLGTLRAPQSAVSSGYWEVLSGWQ